jgi:tRNA isopentenyl-2-thiomethyl-A-37 hydroxylase MiaE
MTLPERLQARFLGKLTSTPAGRAYILATLADAESSDEGQVFDLLAQRVDDEPLQKMIRVHQADEERHAGLFWDEVDRQGVGRPHVPDDIKLIRRLDAELGGGLLERGVRSDLDVMKAYLVLQVIEERAITQFELLATHFARHDAQAARVIAEVARDEQRHLRYCHAIARRYAPDATVHAGTLAEIRRVEAEAFLDNSRANLRHVLDRGLYPAGRLELAGWRWLQRLDRDRQPLPVTSYWGQRPSQTLAA